MAVTRPIRLDPPVDPARDQSLGEEGAEMMLVEYGSYACPSCQAVHEVVADLRDRFGERMRYVFRHRPVRGSEQARRAAELAEFAAKARGDFWQVHDALMKRGPALTDKDLADVAAEFDLPAKNGSNEPVFEAARAKVEQDAQSAGHSGVIITPTFFINGRRYEGPWDENTLGGSNARHARASIAQGGAGFCPLGTVFRIPFTPDVGAGCGMCELAGPTGIRKAVANAIRISTWRRSDCVVAAKLDCRRGFPGDGGLRSGEDRDFHCFAHCGFAGSINSLAEEQERQICRRR
jgi:predicted DsbA family dithiol-disulfide isomerase